MANISMKSKKDLFVRVNAKADSKQSDQDTFLLDNRAFIFNQQRSGMLVEMSLPFIVQLSFNGNPYQVASLGFDSAQNIHSPDLVSQSIWVEYFDSLDYINLLDNTAAGQYLVGEGGGFLIEAPNFTEAFVHVTLADQTHVSMTDNGQNIVFEQPIFYYSVVNTGSDAVVTEPLVIDDIAPELTIAASTDTIAANETTQLTFTFSEAVADFSLDDIQASGGGVSNLTQAPGNPAVWTADFTADGGEINISVLGEDYHDLAGNSGNDAAYTLTVLPTVVSDTLLIDQFNAVKLSGLKAEFYNTGNQLDGSGYSGGIIGEVEAIMNNHEPNATFISSALNYNVRTGDLGKGNHLADWIGDDASTLTFDNKVNSNDAFIRFSGFMSFEQGVHNFRVRADDGYTIRLKIDDTWEDVVVRNQNQSPTTTTHNDFTIPEAGFYEVELLYWDQGGQYELEVELRGPTTDNSYAIVDDSIMSNPSATDYYILAEQLLANDSDAYGYALSIEDVSNAKGGSAHLDSSGNIVFTVNPDHTGPITFDYTVSDGYGGFNTATVALQYADPTLNVDNGFGHNQAGTQIQGSLVEVGYEGGDALTLDMSLLPNDLTANGDLISWQVIGSSLIGSVDRNGDDVSVLELSVDPGQGTYALELFEAIDFPTPDQDPINLNILFTAADTSGDSVSGQLNLILAGDELSLDAVDDQSGQIVLDDSDNLLLVDEANLINFDGIISGGSGIDTIKVDEPGMDLTAAQLNDHFGEGFEIMDLSDGGDNTINLSLSTVQHLSQDSELSVTDTEQNTYDHVLRIVGGDELGETDIINTDTEWKEIGTTDSGSTLYQVGPDAASAPVVELVDIPQQQIVEV